jgi:hypothetical protein
VSAPRKPIRALQRAFAAHLRDPEQVAPPGEHDPRRLDVYRYAVYANIERFMRDNYPRVRAVMNDAEWHAMVRDYLVRHVARASAFVDLPKEFLAYLEHEREPDRAAAVPVRARALRLAGDPGRRRPAHASIMTASIATATSLPGCRSPTR